MIEPLVALGWHPDAAVGAVEQIIRQHLAAHARAHSLPVPQRVPGPAALNAEPVIEAGDRRVQVLASLLHPRVIVFGDLLSARECEALLAAARGRELRAR